MKPDKPTILITGANGQLGNEFRAIESTYIQFNFLFTDRSVLPIENYDIVEKYFSDHNINFCINCAAYTAVDKAESEKEESFLINATGAANLAIICSQTHTKFIHISSDYVFDGTANQPMDESHPTNPLGAYGASKLKGEELVFQNNPDAVILRTSWVYSSYGNNFVKTMLRLMSERESLNVVNDQYGSPTYAADLAQVILKIIISWNLISGRNNVFNYSNCGIITWYDFAMEIKKITASDCVINPIPTSQYPTPAKRPHYSVLDTDKIRSVFNVQIPEWKTSLIKCMGLLGAHKGF